MSYFLHISTLLVGYGDHDSYPHFLYLIFCDVSMYNNYEFKWKFEHNKSKDFTSMVIYNSDSHQTSFIH